MVIYCMSASEAHGLDESGVTHVVLRPFRMNEVRGFIHWQVS